MAKKSVKGFKSYEAATQHAVIPPKLDDQLALLFYCYACLGEEVGEIAGPLKRAARDEGGELTPKARVSLAKELGDVLWTLTRLANALGFTLQEIARLNAEKINDRVRRKKIQGAGDDR